MSPLFEAMLTAWPRLLLVAAVALVVAEAWRRLALRRGVLDVPGHRSSHAVATPRGAGIGIAIAFALAVVLWTPPGTARDAVLLGGLMAAAVGLVDDLRPLRASWKFAGQTLAALPVAIALPLASEGLPVVLPPVVATAAGVAVVLLFVNAWNFMDGINGIAATQAICVALAAVVADVDGWSVIALAVAAGCLGFLVVAAQIWACVDAALWRGPGR